VGRRGPTPKPAWLNKLEGNPGKRRQKSGPKPPPTRPSCPAWLDEDAKAEWARVAPELERLGLLTQLDRAAFACYCQSYADYVSLQKFLSVNGLFYVTPAGKLRERPEAGMADTAMRTMLAFAREFGMTPASRARLNLPPQLSDEDDEFDRWLDGR